jgi:hypothetical protein
VTFREKIATVEELDELVAEARAAGLDGVADALVLLWKRLRNSRTYAAALEKARPRVAREATEAAVHADCEALYEAGHADAARWLASEAGYVLEADKIEEPEDDGECGYCHGSGGGGYPAHCTWCNGRGYAKLPRHREEPLW